jgi:hypothetical protein
VEDLPKRFPDRDEIAAVRAEADPSAAWPAAFSRAATWGS